MVRTRGFTLIEIVLAVAIMMIILLLAVPSLTGVLAERRLKRTLDNFANLVHEAQERSVAEHRAYLIVRDGPKLIVRPEVFAKGEKGTNLRELPLGKNEALKISFPAALTKNPPPEWIFWPTGTCEPAVVEFVGRDGTWTAKYSTLFAQPELMKYAAR